VPDPKTWFALETEFKAFANSHLLEPGRYRLLLQIAAANAKPVEQTVELELSGDWFDSETEMFSKGIVLGTAPHSPPKNIWAKITARWTRVLRGGQS
jgi:hypothetical protein